MADLINVSEAASLGLHAMTYLVAHPDQNATTATMAQRLRVSEHHLAKVMQRLARAGLVASARGPRGGFHLAKDPRQVSLLAVYEAIEGKLEAKACLLAAKPLCPNGRCLLGGLHQSLHKQIKEHFKNTKLADLANVFGEHREN